MASILDKIVHQKLHEIQEAKSRLPFAQLEKLLHTAPPVRDFLSAISGHTSMRLIAEVKKASPSKGVIRPDFEPVAIAQAYQRGGAAALSILTDESFFQGSLEYLRDVRAAVDIPVLRKEFILDEYQVIEARVAGADAILLIAEILTGDQLIRLYDLTRSLNMAALIEFYEEKNLDAVLATGTPIIGVNNRDLHTFQVDLNHSIRMRKRIPADRCLVAESGIANYEDVQLLLGHNIQAILVGESLMRQPDIEAATRTLLGMSSSTSTGQSH